MRIDVLHQAIKDLKEELERVDHVIRHVEALSEGRAYRGRPLKAVSEARARSARSRRRKPPESDNDG